MADWFNKLWWYLRLSQEWLVIEEIQGSINRIHAWCICATPPSVPPSTTSHCSQVPWHEHQLPSPGFVDIYMELTHTYLNSVYIVLFDNIYMELYALVLKFQYVLCLLSFRREVNLQYLCIATMRNIKPWLYIRRVQKVIKLCCTAWWCLLSRSCHGLKYISLGMSHLLAYMLKCADISAFSCMCIF